MIGIIGLNHKTAPVNIRERCVFLEDETVRFMENLRNINRVDEAVMLSTCNRTEIIFYISAECTEEIFSRLIRDLTDFKGITDDLDEHFYMFSEKEAVNHLFQVAAGLDSLVLGEN